jgi:hypothetical protein
MSVRQRKRKRPGRPEAPTPAGQGLVARLNRKWVPIVAALLGLGLVAVVVYSKLPGRESEAAKDRVQAAPVAATSAKDAETSSPTLTPPADVPEPTGKSKTVRPPDADATPERKATASDAKVGFEVLQGRWRRPDGGYVVEVKGVSQSGKMDMLYFNPKRINVAKAEALQDGAKVNVFIELRDVNYPGSTYNLVYDAKDDQLQGIYYQAALRQRFEVFFERMK